MYIKYFTPELRIKKVEIKKEKTVTNEKRYKVYKRSFATAGRQIEAVCNLKFVTTTP